MLLNKKKNEKLQDAWEMFRYLFMRSENEEFVMEPPLCNAYRSCQTHINKRSRTPVVI